MKYLKLFENFKNHKWEECADCGKFPEDYFFNEWSKYIPKSKQKKYICISCLEKRLGRQLKKSDFKPWNHYYKGQEWYENLEESYLDQIKKFESFDIDEDSEHLKDLSLDLKDEGEWSVTIHTNVEKYNEDDYSCRVILEPLDEFDWNGPGLAEGNDKGGKINDTLIKYMESIVAYMVDYEYKIILVGDDHHEINIESVEEFKKWVERELKHQRSNVMTYGFRKDLIIIEFYEKEINESYSDTDKYDDPRTEEDKKNEIEDIVSTELSDEGWTLISKEYKNISGSNVYSFKFNPKSKSNLYLTLGRYSIKGSGTKEKYLNSDIFNKEVWEIEKILKHTLLNDLGYYAKIHWIDDYGWGYYTDGVYSGQPIHRAIIVVDIIEPSWW